MRTNIVLAEGDIVEVLVVTGGQHTSGPIPDELHVFLCGSLSSVPGCGLHGDAGGEHTPEVGDAQQKDKQHRQDEGEFHQRLAASTALGTQRAADADAPECEAEAVRRHQQDPQVLKSGRGSPGRVPGFSTSVLGV